MMASAEVKSHQRTINLCSAQDINYKAYTYDFDESYPQEITIIATCSYFGEADEIYFTKNEDGVFTLMEQLKEEPKIGDSVRYSANISSTARMGQRFSSIVINDGNGSHIIPLEKI